MKMYFTAAAPRQEVVWRPAVDIFRTRRGWLLKFDLAGVRLEDIQVRLVGQRLTVSGVRRDCMLEEGCTYYSMEISYNRFERTIDLPGEVMHAAAALQYQDGILYVRITEEPK